MATWTGISEDQHDLLDHTGLTGVGGGGGGAAIAYQPDAPVDPAEGDLWADSDEHVPQATVGIIADRLRLRRAAEQAATGGIETPIAFDTEDEDTAGLFSGPGTTVIIPAGKSGIWSITVRIQLTAANTDPSYLRISNNTSGVKWGVPIGTGHTQTALGIIVPLADSDSLTFPMLSTSGGTRNFTAHLHMYRIGVVA